MTHPYRPAPTPARRSPWWRRALCALRLHASELDVERGVFVCHLCGRERLPHRGMEALRVLDEQDAHRAWRACMGDRERYKVEYAAWREGTGPEPKLPIPGPGETVWL